MPLRCNADQCFPPPTAYGVRVIAGKSSLRGCMYRVKAQNEDTCNFNCMRWHQLSSSGCLQGRNKNPEHATTGLLLMTNARIDMQSCGSKSCRTVPVAQSN